MQTILGAGGVIGRELAMNLPEYTEEIWLVSRNPQKVNPSDQIFAADLTQKGQVTEAVAGSEIVYLTVGLEYRRSVWEEVWPVIMTNVIDACKQAQARLVFFDNVYLYGKVEGWMTEETPVNPCSEKGKIRAQIARQLMSEVSEGNLEAAIVRSADFYGLGATNTFVHPLVFEKLREGKKANWMANAHMRHSFTFTPDAGRATALLGNTPDAYNQVWHLPTDRNPLTGEGFIEAVASAYGVEPRYSVLPKWMLWLAGLVNPLVRENMEMMYQYDSEYLFDSCKFEERFFQATSYEQGIQQTAEANRG